jgi:hypothetical protein
MRWRRGRKGGEGKTCQRERDVAVTSVSSHKGLEREQRRQHGAGRSNGSPVEVATREEREGEEGGGAQERRRQDRGRKRTKPARRADERDEG